MKLVTGYEYRRARIDMLPLIDVVFLLLVFFIYAMVSMVVHHGLRVDLPTAGQAEVDTRSYIGISISEANALQVNDVPVSLESLAGYVLEQQAQSETPRPVFIEGDQTANLGVAVQILDRLRAAGIEEVSFAVQRGLD